MKYNFVIHPGYAKTGTTTLQRHLFSKHTGIEYIGKPYRDQHIEREINHLISADSIRYDGTALKKYIVRQLEKSRSEELRKVVLLSDETLLSYSKVADKGVIARRIGAICQPRILVTIRNQMDLLTSAYLSRGRLMLDVPAKFAGLHVSLKEWLELSMNANRSSYIRHADYYHTIDYFAAQIGKENICVLLLEELAENQEAYMERVSKFLNIDQQESMDLMKNRHENPKISQHRIDLEQWKTRLFPFSRMPVLDTLIRLIYSLCRVMDKDRPATATIPPDWAKRLIGIYSEGNRKLADQFELPLKKYGYPM